MYNTYYVDHDKTALERCSTRAHFFVRAPRTTVPNACAVRVRVSVQI